MNRTQMKQTADGQNEKMISEVVADLVASNGGWFQVISRMTGSFDPALRNIGKAVDCPFPHRHSEGGGKKAFRFSADPAYQEGRGICTCMQGHGMSAVELLLEDGIGTSYGKCLRKIYEALSPLTSPAYVRKPAAVVVRPTTAEMPETEKLRRKKALDLIARDLVTLDHPSAAPARAYFKKRGIPLNGSIKDVRFHPGLQYWDDSNDESEKKVLVGTFPAIVSAFRSAGGCVVSFHRIYITPGGDKAPVAKVKKLCAPMPGFTGSTITVAATEGRVLHVTEGVEKGWAIHLATGESVKVGYACGSLPKLHVDRAQYDSVVIWSDNDPVQPGRQRQSGDGQYFAWELARRLFSEGFDVTFLMPCGGSENVKGRDWEDVIIQEGVLDLEGAYYRVQTLKTFAVKGGVSKQHARVA